MSIMAGCIDQPCGLEAVGHIYVDSKADYYEINDGLPQHSQDKVDYYDLNDGWPQHSQDE